jgi:hypothetical protein
VKATYFNSAFCAFLRVYLSTIGTFFILLTEVQDITVPTRHTPYGTAAAYAEGMRNANMERIAKLVKIVGMLLQTKVYLFWSKR